jgi:ribonuclease E
VTDPTAQAPAAQPPAASQPSAAAVLFMAPEEPLGGGGAPQRGAGGSSQLEAPAEGTRKRRRARRASSAEADAAAGEPAAVVGEAEAAPTGPAEADDAADESAARARRRGRRGRGRGKGTSPEQPGAEEATEPAEPADTAETGDDEGDGGTVTRRRRRRRRRGGGEADTETADDGVPTVVKVREPRATDDEVRGVTGSTRLEAKRQRRRGGREQRRTRPPVLTESEFLARREAVDRVMVIRLAGDRTQIAVLEDGVLVEHYVSRASTTSMVGSVYLGKVQNVLPSMEAAFVDVGRGRNAVLYAGEVNWDASGLEGKARSIEQALSSGDSVLVQVTKDPVGHKGARLTSNLALSGRHLVYAPYGNASGISRKLPDTERRRLRDILKNIVPDGAGVIVRTAAESATADELSRDVKRLQAQWEDIQAKATSGNAPALLYSEPDLVVRVVRDLFNEDFRQLVVEGENAYDTVEAYLSHVSPDLVARMSRHAGTADVFATYRIDEQILKGLDRKVFLPSGGHLVFDRTEAMTVIDVNTGKYTGTGGNLEETVTRNNLEAAEEIVRQMRLRDIGGIIVIDFIDMVLESNRELVLRRLTECLGRDRTKHQVTEITSLGLVQMTRKRVGAGLLEAFSEPCEHCKGRGVIVHTEPVGDRPKTNTAAEKVKAVASATTGRRRGRKAASPPPATAPDDVDTMGYDLSRYEDVAPLAPPDVTEPADSADLEPAEPEPLEPLELDEPEPAVPDEPGQIELIHDFDDPDEPGLSAVFRRFRRPRGRHRS